MSKRIIAGALAGAVLASTMAPMGVYADSPEVNIWVSKVNATDSGMEKGLEKQTPVHFGSGDSASTNNLIVVDENNTYQTVDGFGASITEASAHLYQTNLDDSAKAAAMQALFDKESGIGLSMLRQTIGASDHCVAPYNFAPDEQDDSLPNWDFSHELIEIMPTVQDALAVEPGRITVMASCWSPPGWMKENGSVLGMYQNQKGTLRADKYQAYANYITKFIQEYASRGIDIYAAGIDAQVANGIPKWRRVPFCGGTTAYTLSILEAVCSTFRHRLRITADDRQLEDTFMMLAVCNGQQYGGGYCAAPHASMTDGLLDVVLLRPVPRLKLPGLLGSYKKGEHLSEGDTVTEKFAPYMTFFRTGSIDIEVLDGNPLITTLDGECSPQLRMHAEIAHSAARILLPPELAANANKTPVLQAMGE